MHGAWSAASASAAPSQRSSRPANLPQAGHGAPRRARPTAPAGDETGPGAWNRSGPGPRVPAPGRSRPPPPPCRLRRRPRAPRTHPGLDIEDLASVLVLARLFLRELPTDRQSIHPGQQQRRSGPGRHRRERFDARIDPNVDPRYFLCHSNYDFQLAHNDGGSQFAQDATFRVTSWPTSFSPSFNTSHVYFSRQSAKRVSSGNCKGFRHDTRRRQRSYSLIHPMS
ncbi:AbfB domain-containing protein [Streptomyces sasae]|uniref:AbfB domain-containing protein n=1 Tax=Streptomyces sasae TaxID=1266772 RepID=UPI003741E8BC